MTAPKLPLRLTTDHLKNNPKRRFGPEPAGKVFCQKHHTFYVAWEGCSDCPTWEELCDTAASRFHVLEDTQPCPKPVDEYDDGDTMVTGMWP